jgi:gliding motility-associated-like protein
MRKILVATFLLIFFAPANAQDLSNKGKDFWVGYGYHVRMAGANGQQMVLYFTSDVTANVKIEIPSIGYVQNLTVAANTVVTSNALPKTGSQDARLRSEGVSDRGIHITSDKGVVAYAHIYDANVSGASLLFPTATLGNEYYSINFTQSSNEPASNSWFYVIATEDNTTVEITPSSATIGGKAAGVPFLTTLNKGQIYNVMGVTNGNSGADLTGSRIRSISTASSGCKRIAVFSGAGKMNIGCSNGSADNLIQQVFPRNAWGKKYLTAPTATNPNNFFRVAVLNPGTIVKYNGTVLTGLVNNFYYQFSSVGAGVVEADDQIMVAQYISSQGCFSNTAPAGDPEMIYLSPVEQTINNVTLNSTPNFNITGHYINVIMKATDVGSFKIDGMDMSTSFITHPQDAEYKFAQFSRVSAGQHRLTADSGFNAIAYGFGNAESYGYNAGTNLKDIYQYVTVGNDYATVNFPAGCKNSPFKFSMTFPYQPVQIKWEFGAALNALGLTDTTLNNPVADSTFVLNGKTLYRYKLKRTYVINTSGTYPIQVIANNPSPDGCIGLQEIDYDLQIFDPPTASFTLTNSGCITDPVLFTDQTVTTDPTLNPVQKWYWDFGDGGKGKSRKESHTYAAGGSFPVKFAVITAVGCLSDTARKTIDISAPPVANFSVQSLLCEKNEVTLRNESTVPPGNTLAKWYWDFGDGTKTTNPNGNDVKHTYTTAGSYSVKLEVETSAGCKSIAFTQLVKVNPQPKPDFVLPGSVCLPTGQAQFTNSTTISDGSVAQLTYNWNFGDGGTATDKDPIYNYTTGGPYSILLKATSKDGCIDSVRKQLTTIYSQPIADFDVSAEVCIGTATTFTDKSDGKGSAIAQYKWDYDDGQTNTLASNSHTYAVAKTYNPTLVIVTDKGCSSAVATKPTLVNSLPVANFNTNGAACQNKQINFTDISNPGAGAITKWNWNFDDGGTSTDANPGHTYNTIKTYNVSLTVESSTGCKSAVAVTKPVKVNYLPRPDFGTPEVCLNDPIAQFSDSSKIDDGSEAQFTYLWNFDLQGNPGATGVGKKPTYTYNVAKNYQVKLTVTSKDGCAKDTTKTFTVNGAIPKAGFSVSNSNSLCSNTDVSIADASTVDFGKVVKVEIYWDYRNNPLAKTTDDEPASGKSYTYNYPDFALPRTKSFEVRYVAYSGINCLNETSQVITVNATPEIQFDPLQAVCEEIPSFQITEAKEISGFTGVATYSGPGMSASGIFNPRNAKPGLHTIKYAFVAGNGCRAEAEEKIRVYPTPVLDAGPDRYLLEGGSAILQPIVTGNGLTYLWTPPINLDNPLIRNPKITAVADTRYVLAVTSADGCVAVDSILVKILKSLVVPNAFTPNGDGINDTWVIEYLESYPGATVQVYNRYGQLVFNSSGYPKPWNGTVNGNALPVGTYYWIINPKNGRAQINGSVTIIR